MLKILKKSTYENMVSKIKRLEKLLHNKDAETDRLYDRNEALINKYKGAPLRNPKTGRYIKAK